MSRKQKSVARRKIENQNEKTKRRPIVWVIVLCIVLLGVAGSWFLKSKKSAPEPIEISGPVTFSKDIAPIIFENCSGCHHAGQSGPFDLVTYSDVESRAKDIARVTASKLMPPFLPEHGDFVEERSLTERQIALIQKWVQSGAPEGNPADMPPTPTWPLGWVLGKPDLVIELEPNEVAPEGKDIYFNYVTPIPVATNRYVSGVEFLPSSRTVHHAFLMVDETPAARRLASKNSPPAFYGMDTPESVVMPGGQLLGWQPGKIPTLSGAGLAWILRTNTDLVLQLHLNPSGKPEKIRPKLGFHFTDVPPTNTAFRLRLNALELDIPPGVSNYVTESTYTLPVDLNFVRVGAHAHYLCRRMEGTATLPNGEKKSLLLIRDWDFKWQGDYQYKQPVFLPQGTKISMRFTYDNSTNNVRNPFNPPRRTLWGLNTTDEMGELYFQTAPRTRAEYEKLGADYNQYVTRVSVDFYKFRTRVNPADAEGHERLGRAYLSFGEMAMAQHHLLEAIRLNPDDDKAYFDLGSTYLRQGRRDDAFGCFKNVVRLNPDDSQAYGSLGIISLQSGRTEEARDYLLAALRIDPDDALAQKYLRSIK